MCSRLPRGENCEKSCRIRGVLHCAAASETCLAKIVCVARYVTCNFLGNLSGSAVARHIAEILHNVTADLDGTTLAYNCFMRRFFFAHYLRHIKIVYDSACVRLLVVTMCLRVLNPAVFHVHATASCRLI